MGNSEYRMWSITELDFQRRFNNSCLNLEWRFSWENEKASEAMVWTTQTISGNSAMLVVPEDSTLKERKTGCASRRQQWETKIVLWDC